MTVGKRRFAAFFTIIACVQFVFMGRALPAPEGPEVSSETLIVQGPVAFSSAPSSAPSPAAVRRDAGADLALALVQAYEHNPALRAARMKLMGAQEQVPQALSGWKPDISAKAGMTAADIESGSSGGRSGTTKEMELGLTQPLYRGGRTVAASAGADQSVRMERALLAAREQDLILEAATAYMNVVRDRALYDLSEGNRKVIAGRLDETRSKFEAGILTRTDLMQAQARLAAADAGTIRGAGELRASEAVYEKVIGVPPGGSLFYPDVKLPFPDTLDEAYALADRDNPRIVAAEHLHKAAVKDIDRTFGELLPEIGLFANWNRQYDPQPGLAGKTTTELIGVSASVPIFEGGLVRSKVRQAKYAANRYYLDVMETRNAVRQEVAANWEKFRAARAEIESRKAQVDAAELANRGVHEEAMAGARTTLDALDAEQELQDARVALVAARRDEIVAAFSLARSTGLLTPGNLGLADYTDRYERNLREIRWKNLGMDVDIGEGSP